MTRSLPAPSEYTCGRQGRLEEVDQEYKRRRSSPQAAGIKLVDAASHDGQLRTRLFQRQTEHKATQTHTRVNSYRCCCSCSVPQDYFRVKRDTGYNTVRHRAATIVWGQVTTMPSWERLCWMQLSRRPWIVTISARGTWCRWRAKSTAWDRAPSPSVSRWNRSSSSPCWPNGRRSQSRSRRRWASTGGRRPTPASDPAWRRSTRRSKLCDGPFRRRPPARRRRPTLRRRRRRPAARRAAAVRPAAVKSGPKSRRCGWPWTTSRPWPESWNTTLCSWTTTTDSAAAVSSSPTAALSAVWAASAAAAAATCHSPTTSTLSTTSPTSARPVSTTAAATTTWPSTSF